MEEKVVFKCGVDIRRKRESCGFVIYDTRKHALDKCRNKTFRRIMRWQTVLA